MAARCGRLRALVLVTLISFLLVQGALGKLGAAAEFGICYCDKYRKCTPQHHGDANACIKTAHSGCINKFKKLCPKYPAGPDMGTVVAAAAGGRNLSEASGAGEETAA